MAFLRAPSPIIQHRSLKECSGRTARMATEGSRVVIGGYCKECLRRREADIVSSMSIGPVGVRVGKRPRRVGSLFGCRANANRRLKLNNTAAKLRRNHLLLKVNLVEAGKLEVVDPHVGRNTH